MKICFFNCTKLWGGGEKWHLEHALAFSQKGHDVTIVTNKNSELLKRAVAANIKTVQFSINSVSFLSFCKLCSIYSFFKKEKFDVVIMNFSNDLKVAAPMAKLANVPKIVYRRGSDIPIRNTFLNRFLFRHCLTDVLTNSKATKQSILHNNPNLFPSKKIKIIYNGIDIHSVARERKEHQIPVIGILSRMVYQKGIDILLDIAAILKKRNVSCKIKIGGEGILKNTLLQKAQQEGLSGYVEFDGFIENPEEFMNQIDIFVLTSRWEGFGYVLAEAMLAQKPIVAFDVSSNSELITNDVNGFLIPFENKEKFANAIQELVEDRFKRERFGKAGLDIVRERFDFEKNKQAVIDYLVS